MYTYLPMNFSYLLKELNSSSQIQAKDIFFHTHKSQWEFDSGNATSQGFKILFLQVIWEYKSWHNILPLQMLSRISCFLKYVTAFINEVASCF